MRVNRNKHQDICFSVIFLMIDNSQVLELVYLKNKATIQKRVYFSSVHYTFEESSFAIFNFVSSFNGANF